MSSNWHRSPRVVKQCALGVAFALSVALCVGGEIAAQTPSASAQKEAREEIGEAVEAFNGIMTSPDHAIPSAVLERAVGIGVFAKVVQAAFIAGGRGGDGVITAQSRDGVRTVPAFFRLGGASVGLQIGGSRTDIIFVFTTQRALDALLDDRLEFGTEVKAVAGPNAAELPKAAATTKDAGILIYSRDRGLFAGVAMEGAVIRPHNDLNRALYGATAEEILRGHGPKDAPAIVRPFLDALQKP